MDYELGNDIKLLSDLLKNPKHDDASSEEDEPPIIAKNTNTYLSPADVAQSQKTEDKPSPSPYEKIPEKTDVDYQDEYEKKVEECTDGNLWKKTPEWDVTYRQSVTASDVFLQMGNKTPATASCENMIVTIKLPGESRPSIDLKIHAKELILTSARYYLKLPLQQPVNPRLGNAQFDNATESLAITLVLDREFDFVNF